MQVKASLNFVKVGAQKARLVADVVRGKKVDEALKVLKFMKKKSAPLIYNLLNSAVSNAENKKTIDTDNLYIKTIYVNQGPVLKRFRPRAKGSASGIRKKTSHIHLVLDEKRK